MIGWLTNDPEAAAKLMAADDAYKAAREAAKNLCLKEKVAAYTAAKLARQTAYDELRGEN